MNGRIYDPLIGRFMSADPYIQAPDDLQSHNRYAYVMNNPLNLTDSSGFNWLTKTWKKAWKSPIFRAVLGIIVAVAAPYALTWLAPTLFVASSLPLALATGALSGFAATGTLKGALTGAFTAGIMFGVGEIGQALNLESGGIGKVALHAGAGCVGSVAGGGSCKTGAISGALGELGNNIPDGGRILNTVKASRLGGIGSKIAGGKFEDGATTGAFGYLFNELMHLSVPVNEKARNVIAMADDKIGANIEAFFNEVRGLGIDMKLNDAFRTNGLQALQTGNKYGGAPYNSSLHEAGFAFDVNWNDFSKTERQTVLDVAKKHKFDWGRSFKTYDPVHFSSTPKGDRKTLIKAVQKDFFGGL